MQRDRTRQVEQRDRTRQVEQVASRLDGSHLMVSAKMLEVPEKVKNRDKAHLIAPLLVRSHNYPKQVGKAIAEESSDKTRGIGAYREVNWYFHDKHLKLWVSDKDYEVELSFEEEINCLAMSQLKGASLPSKIKNRYMLAIGLVNTVVLKSVNNFTLEIFDTGIHYELRHTLRLEKLKFVDQSKLIMIGDTGCLQVAEFGGSEPKGTVKTT